jgi:hypothetical protein
VSAKYTDLKFKLAGQSVFKPGCCTFAADPV